MSQPRVPRWCSHLTLCIILAAPSYQEPGPICVSIYDGVLYAHSASASQRQDVDRLGSGTRVANMRPENVPKKMGSPDTDWFIYQLGVTQHKVGCPQDTFHTNIILHIYPTLSRAGDWSSRGW